MKVEVTDTGPLLHLNQVGAVHLLAYLGDIQVTPSVWAELQRHAPGFAVTGLPGWLTLWQPSFTAMSQASQWISAQVLHVGEAEALAYARETRADMFLTDDTAARTMGELLGIHVRGSLGVVLFAAAAGHLNRTSCEQILSDLEHHSDLWMSAKVKKTASQALTLIFG